MAKYIVYNENGNHQYVDTQKMEFIAQDAILNYEGCTRNTQLYITPRSKRFFLVHQTMWQGEHNSCTELTHEQALEFVTTDSKPDVNELNSIMKEYFPGSSPLTELE